MDKWKDDYWGVGSIKLDPMGYRVDGKVLLDLWDGSHGWINMTSHTLDQMGVPTKNQVKQTINDGGYGCESIKKADVDVYAVYTGGYEKPITTYHFSKKDCENAQRSVRTKFVR